MKRKIILFLMVQPICATLYAQTVHFGPFSGTLGTKSSYFGYNAARDATAASSENSFFGYNSGLATISMYNSGFGTYALTSNTSGVANTATGYHSLYSNTTAKFNTANGHSSLWSNKTGDNNTAVGAYSLYANVDGHENTAIGNFSLYVNKTGYGNTASGIEALYSNNVGVYNTANGGRALYKNETGHFNTAIGGNALYSNLTGGNNTASGLDASRLNSRGNNNTANGYKALYANTVGGYNSAFGSNAGPNSTSLENTTALGNLATTTASNQVRIGNTNVVSIGGQVMWTTLSDGRFKKNIKEDVSGLEFVNQLRPVSYEVDKTAVDKFLNIPDSLRQQQTEAKKAPVRQTGFIAQEVEAVIKKTGYVFSGVEAPQNENDHYGIRYAEFVVPLVKAVQELTTKLNEQEKKSEEQQLEITALKQKLGVIEEGTTGDMNTNVKVVLFQNNPNPFSQDTEIKMALPETTRQATLIIYNMEGKQLKNFQVNDRGNASVKISGNDFSAGIYLYALIVDGKVVDTKRLILTK